MTFSRWESRREPPRASVCHMIPSGALILSVASVAPLEFLVPSLIYSTFLIWPPLLVLDSIPPSKPYHTWSTGILCVCSLSKCLLSTYYLKVIAKTWNTQKWAKIMHQNKDQREAKYCIHRAYTQSSLHLGYLSVYPSHKWIETKEQL